MHGRVHPTQDPELSNWPGGQGMHLPEVKIFLAGQLVQLALLPLQVKQFREHPMQVLEVEL